MNKVVAIAGPVIFLALYAGLVALIPNRPVSVGESRSDFSEGIEGMAGFCDPRGCW